jgi:hypothetical protein
MPTPEGQAFDIAQGKFVEVEEAGTATTTATETETKEEEEIVEQPGDKDEPEDEEPKEEVVVEEPKKEEAKSTETPAATFEPATYLKEKYSDFGVESEEDLLGILQATDALADELDALKKNPPSAFRNEKEQKIAEFLKQYDPSKFGEGLSTYGTLMDIDPDNLDDRRAMEEAYILENPEFTREEAKLMFAKDYKKKTALNKEDFEDDAEYEAEKKLLELKLRKEATKSKIFLRAEKEKLKTAPEEKAKEEEKKPLVAPEAVETYTKQVDNFFKTGQNNKPFDRFTFTDPNNKDVSVNIVLDKAKQNELKGFMNKYVTQGSLYKENKIPNFDPAEIALMGSNLLFGNWMIQEMFNQVPILASKLKAEQIAGKKPVKESKGTGTAGIPSIDQQWENLAKKEVQGRTKK